MPTGGTSAATRRRVAGAAAAGCALALLSLTSVLGPHEAGAQAGGKPNVVLIVTDDQAMSEMRALPQTQALIGGAGVTFNRAYISYPLCCPSRATILSGQFMHNNGVRGNLAPDGGWERFKSTGTEAVALPTWLADAGYYNVQLGKYMNGYGGTEPPPVPPGWDEWYGKLSEYDDGAYGGRVYFNYQMREDPPAVGGVACPSGGPVPPGSLHSCIYGQSDSDYQTDVVKNKAVEAIDRLSGPAAPQTPFFMSVDFSAPHSPYIPAPRHQGAFASAPMGKPAGQNEEDVRDKPRFLRRLPRLGKGKLKQITKRRRARLEMLLSVDEAIAAIVARLQAEGELANTLLIFTSDNGYFSGEHRIRQGKFLPHEPSSHVPLLMRGPGIPAGTASDELVSNVDIASTIAHAAGATPKLVQDGISLLPLAQNPSFRTTRPVFLEGDTGQSVDDDGAENAVVDSRKLKKFRKKLKRQKREIKRRCAALRAESPKRALRCKQNGVSNLDQEPTDKNYKLRAPAYAAIRSQRYLLILYSTGELELYDVSRDPAQVNSLHRDKRFKPVRKFLLAQLPRYANCDGAACAAPLGIEPKPLKKGFQKRRKKKAEDEPAKEEPAGGGKKKGSP